MVQSYAIQGLASGMNAMILERSRIKGLHIFLHGDRQ